MEGGIRAGGRREFMWICKGVMEVLYGVKGGWGLNACYTI